MCGIVGFTGEHQAAPIILDGLSKLEYRGYDSAGMAVRDGEGEYQMMGMLLAYIMVLLKITRNLKRSLLEKDILFIHQQIQR